MVKIVLETVQMGCGDGDCGYGGNDTDELDLDNGHDHHPHRYQHHDRPRSRKGWRRLRLSHASMPMMMFDAHHHVAHNVI
eukprot:6190257-Pleurochrysis_carterae.AAC.3